METMELSRKKRAESREGGLREEGELSDDENEEDILRYRQRSSRTHDASWLTVHAERNHPNSGSRGEPPYSYQKHYRHSPPEQERYSRHVDAPRYNRYGGRKRSHGADWSDEELHRKERQSNNIATPSSKIWENRRFRASSVRPRTPPVKTGGHENEDELLELVRQQERIRKQLQNLEEEEKRSVTPNTMDGDEKGRSSDDDYILDMIEQFPSKTLAGEGTPASPLPGSIPTDESILPSSDLGGGKQLKSINIDMEDISDEEDFDEQKLRILALATSARHNQLLAKGIKNETSPVNRIEIDPSPKKKEEQGVAVVIIPDIEPDMPEPEIVVVPEDEENVKEPAKSVDAKKGERHKGKSSSSKGSKDKAKSRSKKKKRGSSKEEAKKKSSIHARKVKLSDREWSKKQKVLKALALKDPQLAVDKFMRYAREGVLDVRPPTPKLTGTMGDFKRQKRLPLLSEKQRQEMLDKNPKDRDSREKPKRSSEKKGPVDVGDNYEEVEMEITSDCEEKDTTKEKGDPTLDRLNLGAEFSQAMQPISMMPYLPGHLDNIGLPSSISSMTTFYPPVAFNSHTLETTTPSSSQAPPLPQLPPPLPPLPPPPPPPPLVGSPPCSSLVSLGRVTAPSEYADAYVMSTTSYRASTAGRPVNVAIPDNDASVQSMQKKRIGFSPEVAASQYFSPTNSVSWKESNKRRTDSFKQISVADISSQLHRLRKAQEKVKSFGSAMAEEEKEEEEAAPIHSFSRTDDISQGFWLCEEYNNKASLQQSERGKSRSLLESPNKHSEDYEYSSHKDSLYYGHDIMSRPDVVEYKPSPKAYTDSLELRRLFLAQSPPPLPSSSRSSSPGQGQPERRSPAPDLSPPSCQQTGFGVGDAEKDNSDDEDELRKQLLTSLALKRLSSAVTEESPVRSSQHRETGKRAGEDDHSDVSDEEPVPPPVVKRVWTSPSQSTPDNGTEDGWSKPEISSQQTMDTSMPSTQIRELGMDKGEDIAQSGHGDVLQQDRYRAETGHGGPSIHSPFRSDLLRAFSDSDASLKTPKQSNPETSLSSTGQAPSSSPSPLSSCQQLQLFSRPSITFQVKSSKSKLQALKMKPSVARSNSIVSEKPRAVDQNSSKSLSSALPSSVIKTIYSSSQSLSSVKSTSVTFNGSINGQKERRQTFFEASIDLHRTSSPSAFMENASTTFSSHSSSSDLREVAMKQQKKFSTLEVPIHPSVIVPLHPSSDEEEEEEDALKTSEGDDDGLSSDQSKMEMRKLMTEEKLLQSQKKEIIADQEHLRNLLARAGEALKAQRLAESRRDALQAQIVALMEKEKAVGRMAVAQERLKDKIKMEARDVKNRLLKSKPSFLEKTKSIMSLGRSIIGPDFIPKALRATPKLKAESQPKQMLTKSQKIAIEKQKLREKEQEIAEKLRVLKESTNSGATKKRQTPTTLTQEKPSDVIRLDQENVDVLLPRKRKKSRLSTDASKTPNLPMTPKAERLKSSENSAFKDACDPVLKDDDAPVFQMPKGSQLSNLRKILVEEKVEKALRGGSSIVDIPGTDFYAAFNGSSKMGNLNLNLAEDRRRHKPADSMPMPASLAYSSPLKMLRSYRFSKFYRTKEALSFTSKTFSHKINPNCIMCPYDLRGTCNDDKCQQQHPKDYEPSDREILEDLVSFHPEVTGVKAKTSKESIRKSVLSYVDAFLAKHKDRLTLEEMCLLLTSDISRLVGHGQAVCPQARRWKLEAKEEKGLNVHLGHQPSFKNLQLFDLDKSSLTDKDAHIGEEDIRYFVSEGTDAISLEEAVLENPHDTKLWLHLSARKLADPNWTPRECLDQALNVLARALEANRSDPDLWLQYLVLYKKHSDVNDFPQFCQTALEYAPSYELWFMYLSSLKTYHEKESACLKALDFLCQNPIQTQWESHSSHPPSTNPFSPNSRGQEEPNCNQNSSAHTQASLEPKKRSHCVLEMIVYYTNLNILTGHFKTAVKFLQGILGERESSTPHSVGIREHLSVCHTLVVWMVYIHVVEWRQLPRDLFLGANENPSRIASEKLSLSWPQNAKLYTPLKTLVRLHKTAAKVWTSSQRKEEDAEEQFVSLIKSLVALLCSQQCVDEVPSLCVKVLSQSNLVDIWLTAASVHVANQNLDGVKMVFTEAIKKNRYSAKLQFYRNVFLCSQGKSEEALQSLEQFIINCFDVSSSSKSVAFHWDPNLLFCQLLNLQEGFSIHSACKPVSDLGTNPTKDVFMWLCYCQLLELQGEREEAVEMFERSLSHVQSPSDLVLIWQSYIAFLLRTGDSSPPLPLQDLLIRSVISMPMRLPLPFSASGASAVDYRHSNRLLEVWLGLLPQGRQLDVIEKCLDYMPGNVPLVVRGLELSISMRETRRAFCWCKMAAAHPDKPTLMSFWKIASALAYSEGSPREVERMLMRCAHAMPLAVTAWKDLLLFEVTREEHEVVSQILSRCADLGLNVQDYVQTLSAKPPPGSSSANVSALAAKSGTS